jgi:hypothetical protein
MVNKDPKEYMWVDVDSAPEAQTAASSLFHLLGTDSVRNGKSQ